MEITSGIVGNTPGFDCAGACLTGDLVTVTLYDSYGDWNGGTLTVDGNVYDKLPGTWLRF